MTHSQCEAALAWQKAQYGHDKRNHFDILSLHKSDRLKHYGLHFAKYAGRLARGDQEKKSKQQTAVDSLLVSLSAANTLHQHLAMPDDDDDERIPNNQFEVYVSSAGQFCDACEKIDHTEFDGIKSMFENSNSTLFKLSLLFLKNLQTDPLEALSRRRNELAARAFYVGD
ncbi:MAG: hypothetical protein QNJ16_11580 [Rhodobacter sp.]|nr:hypothetical protein [Rhodobacter sp.]